MVGLQNVRVWQVWEILSKLDAPHPARQVRLRVVTSGCRGSNFGFGLVDQTGHGGRHLRANACPMRDTVKGHAQGLVTTRRHGVVKTHALDEAAVTALTLVGHNDAEKWAAFGTAACESNDDHDGSFWG
jgi:hypothetical protein